MLIPLVNQFGLMQQQMFDQFQQAMAMMVQMFGRMHHDQMDMIRAELDQLRELTEEFHALKKELANRTGSETAAGDLAGAPAESSSTPAIEPGVSASTPLAAPSEPSGDLGLQPGLGIPRKPTGEGPAANSERESVVWLHQRIISLQRERESRWQKILKLLPGMS
jgi:hypothetical protein